MMAGCLQDLELGNHPIPCSPRTQAPCRTIARVHCLLPVAPWLRCVASPANKVSSESNVDTTQSLALFSMNTHTCSHKEPCRPLTIFLRESRTERVGYVLTKGRILNLLGSRCPRYLTTSFNPKPTVENYHSVFFLAVIGV